MSIRHTLGNTTYDEVVKNLVERHDAISHDIEGLLAQYKGSTTMTAEDASRFDALVDEAEVLEADLERVKRAQRVHKFASEPVTGHPQPTTVTRDGPSEDEAAKLLLKQQTAFRAFLRHGDKGLGNDDLMTLKALQADSDVEGGFLVAPQEFIAQLIQAVDDALFLRQLGRVITLTRAESLGVPTLETDLNDADWTSELATGNEDTSLRFGKRELFPHPLAKRIKLSRKLIRQAAIDPESLVRDRMAYKFGVTQEKAFLTGNGTQQPLGLFTASTAGISTARDITTGATTDVTPDSLINAVYFLKPQYLAKAEWILHRDVLRNIRKLKDADGNYIWVSGLQQNRAPSIMERPYRISEFAPNTFTTGQYLAILGDYSFYWIAEALGLQIQVLTELYAETNQIGYIGRVEVDAMPVLEEAFVRVKTS